MKKLEIIILCATLLLGWILLTNAKDSLTNLIINKDGANVHNVSWMTGDYHTTWATAANVEPEQEWEMCDFDNDWKVNVDDITRYIGECLNKTWNDPKCDIDGNWKFDVEDMLTYKSTCFNKVLWNDSEDEEPEQEWEMCDLNEDWEISIADENRFNSYCNIINWTNQKKCDLNGDWEINIADINLFNYKCINEIIWKDQETITWTQEALTWTLPNKYELWNNDERTQAYSRAYENWITTKSNIESANMKWNLNRIEMAKMLSQYAINVLWKEPNTSKWSIKFSDVSERLNKQYWNAVTTSYQLWIMWQNIRNNKFRPYDRVTRAEFATALSRLLYNTKDGKWNTRYYEPHMKLLNQNWIMNDITTPKNTMTRWNAMLMMFRTNN